MVDALTYRFNGPARSMRLQRRTLKCVYKNKLPTTTWPWVNCSASDGVYRAHYLSTLSPVCIDWDHLSAETKFHSDVFPFRTRGMNTSHPFTVNANIKSCFLTDLFYMKTLKLTAAKWLKIYWFYEFSLSYAGLLTARSQSCCTRGGRCCKIYKLKWTYLFFWSTHSICFCRKLTSSCRKRKWLNNFLWVYLLLPVIEISILQACVCTLICDRVQSFKSMQTFFQFLLHCMFSTQHMKSH